MGKINITDFMSSWPKDSAGFRHTKNSSDILSLEGIANITLYRDLFDAARVLVWNECLRLLGYVQPKIDIATYNNGNNSSIILATERKQGTSVPMSILDKLEENPRDKYYSAVALAKTCGDENKTSHTPSSMEQFLLAERLGLLGGSDEDIKRIVASPCYAFMTQTKGLSPKDIFITNDGILATPSTSTPFDINSNEPNSLGVYRANETDNEFLGRLRVLAGSVCVSDGFDNDTTPLIAALSNVYDVAREFPDTLRDAICTAEENAGACLLSGPQETYLRTATNKKADEVVKAIDDADHVAEMSM